MSPAARASWTIAALAGVLQIALVVAGLGGLALAANVDPVPVGHIVPAVGPIGVGLAVLATVSWLARAPRLMWRTVLGAGLVSWTALWSGITVASVILQLDPVAALLLGVRTGGGWLGAVIAASAVVSGMAALMAARWRESGHETPRWPWDHDDEREDQ